MEKQNKVPTDIERRRLIANLLDIPPVLLGLASLETVRMQPQIAAEKGSVQTHLLKKVSIDLTPYHNDIHLSLHLHKTSHAQEVMGTILADIQNLQNLESQARGDLLYHIQELLLGNYLLATKIVKDSRNYAQAYIFANEAVRVAKSMKDKELIAAAKYVRGCTKLEWGSFGSIRCGIFQPNKEKINEAIRDLQDVLKQAQGEPESVHPQLHGFAMLQLSRAQGLLVGNEQKQAITQTLVLVDQASDYVGKNALDNVYTRLLVTGTVSGLHSGAYHLIKAEVLTILGLTGQAYSELKRVKELTEKTYGRDETRNHAWIDVATSKSCIGLDNYAEATEKAKEALIACQDISSVQNIAVIVDIYGRLVASSYGMSEDVRELGKMLKEFTRTHGSKMSQEGKHQ
jgi:tetratricopeptide (TPR) repeat protein